ncbi:DUF6191 domain-containing protein [Psychromicrobium lacuslunae]|uniref:Uncharacterized protein n=1 Tax=Psychromicrobium lacuslunae TaxID=1618207 RepID=A0A0D4C2B3_9MICC|nr:DUF6191 domain-containing protein [Psychromicrobium lacuslunae]AJT42491.1 hypothetical protein UM93_15115 [Psychromicrobium lacuslunae]
MSNGLGGAFGSIDSIFNPGRAHQLEEEARQLILPVTVDSPDKSGHGIEIDLDAGVAVIRQPLDESEPG